MIYSLFIVPYSMRSVDRPEDLSPLRVHRLTGLAAAAPKGRAIRGSFAPPTRSDRPLGLLGVDRQALAHSLRDERRSGPAGGRRRDRSLHLPPDDASWLVEERSTAIRLQDSCRRPSGDS